MSKLLIEIKNIHAHVVEKPEKVILRGLNLSIREGEIHAIMGPNGSGKSTLAGVLTGNPSFEVTEGEIVYQGKNLLGIAPEERAHNGIFMSFQYPKEIPGVSMANFMRTALNEKRKAHGEEPISAVNFLKLMDEKRKLLQMDKKLVSRAVNEGFSGGEKKKNEIFQMLMLDPTLAILDETDSGLDIDALRLVAEGVNKLHSPQKAFLVITHYQRLLDYIKPHFVHILRKGQIVETGDATLALKLEKEGYSWLEEEEAN